MNWTKVSSSNVHSVGYNPIDKKLGVTFNNGRVYFYHGVPVGVYESFMSAGSKGSFVHTHLKNVYPITRG